MLNKLDLYSLSLWASFSEVDFTSAIIKCNNLLASETDKLSWRHLKSIIKDKTCLSNIIAITNTCFNLEHQPNHFKNSMTIVIPKPNKTSYDSPKSFRPIVLLNTLGKLIKKVISDRLQFHIISNNFILQSQPGGLKFKSTTDASITLTHFICME